MKDLWPWFLLAAPIILITKYSQPDAGHHFLPSFPQRVLVAGDSLSFYAGKLFWPGAMAPDYGRTPQLVLNHPWLYLTALLPFLVLAFLAWRYRQPLLWLAIALFIIPLLPVLGIVPFNYQKISTVADRYLYLSMVGPALLTGWLLSRHRQRTVVILTLLCLTGLAVRSTLLLGHWRDSYSINNRILAINPTSGKALNNLGMAYQEDNQFREAIAIYLKAVLVAPDNPEAYMNLGNLYRRFGNHDEAARYYRKSIELAPGEALNYCNLGEIFMYQGDGPAALVQFRLAVEKDPSLARAQAGINAATRQMERL